MPYLFKDIFISTYHISQYKKAPLKGRRSGKDGFVKMKELFKVERRNQIYHDLPQV